MMIGHDILSESAAADCHLDQRKPTAILIYYNIFYSRFRFFFFFWTVYCRSIDWVLHSIVF